MVEETDYSSRVPVLIGTNVLRKTLDDLVDIHVVRFAQKARLPSTMHFALLAVHTVQKHLKKKKSVVCGVRLHEAVVLAPGEGWRVSGRVTIDTLLPAQVVLVSGVGEYEARGVEVTPTVVAVGQGSPFV